METWFLCMLKVARHVLSRHFENRIRIRKVLISNYESGFVTKCFRSDVCDVRAERQQITWILGVPVLAVQSLSDQGSE